MATVTQRREHVDKPGGTHASPVFALASSVFTDAHRWDGVEMGADRADATIFGAPFDLTESFRQGAAGGPAAVREMSASLEAYSPVSGRDLQDLSIVDLGDLRFEGSEIDEALSTISAAMEIAALHSELAVMIGGEHTVSLGGFRGVRRVYPDTMLVQFDAHLDIRPEYEGHAMTHASWVFHAGTEFGFGNIVQLGIRSGERDEWPRARELTAYGSEDVYPPSSLIDRLKGHPIYLTVDIDVLDPSCAPGTGCPEPGGASFRELTAALHALAQLHIVAVDVVEVAPNLDPAGITAVAAAKIIRDSLLLFTRPNEMGQ